MIMTKRMPRGFGAGIGLLMIGMLFFCLAYIAYLDEWYIDTYVERINQVFNTSKRFVEAPALSAREANFIRHFAYASDLFDKRMLEAHRLALAEDFSGATEVLRPLLADENSPRKRALIFYQLGRILLSLDEPIGAVEMFQSSLRNNPDDLFVVFDLERLLYLMILKEGGKGKASLPRAPGANTPEENRDSRGGDEQGRNTPRDGI